MDNSKASVLLPPVPCLRNHLPEKKTMRAQGGKGTWLNMSEILAKDVQQWTWFLSIQFSLHNHSSLRGLTSFTGSFTASSSSLTELSQQANIPPASHPHAARCLYRDTLGWDADLSAELWTLTQAHRVFLLVLQEGQMGGVSFRYPVMLSCIPGTGLNPLAHKQQWKDLLTLCQEASASLLSAPTDQPHWPHGKRSQLWHHCLIFLFPWSLSGAHSSSLDLYHCILEVACGSEHSFWALQ